MKRLFLLALLLTGGALWAQTADSVAAGRALGDEPQVRRSRERNVLGAPVYYDTLGNVIGQPVPADSLYRRPRHHFRNRLENEYNSVFFEGMALVGGRDLAAGMQMAYLPNRWGVYGNAMVGLSSLYCSIGPVLRLSDCGDYLDWQLYGGLVVSRRFGAEVGMRLAGPRSNSGFGWTSFTVSAGYANRQGYMTLGFSLALMPEILFFFWL